MSSITNSIFDELKRNAMVLQERAKNGYSAYLMPQPLPPHKEGAIVMWAYDGKLISGKVHDRDFFSLQYIYRGNVTEDINGLSIPLHEKDILLVQPDVRHGITHESLSPNREDTIVVYVAFKKEYVLKRLLQFIPNDTKMLDFFVSAFNKDNCGRYIILRNTENPQVKDIIEMIMTEYVNMQQYYDVILNTLVEALMTILTRDSIIHDSVVQTEDKISVILSYIKENCSKVSLNESAERFGYHPNYLSALLKKETGKSFATLIKEFRLEKACYLIANSNFSINEIAGTVGYGNISHFYSSFKEKYGVLPSQYRKQEIS